LGCYRDYEHLSMLSIAGLAFTLENVWYTVDSSFLHYYVMNSLEFPYGVHFPSYLLLNLLIFQIGDFKRHPYASIESPTDLASLVVDHHGVVD
jgi:hypothetical protein